MNKFIDQHTPDMEMSARVFFGIFANTLMTKAHQVKVSKKKEIYV